jgi:hypothetical protein
MVEWGGHHGGWGSFAPPPSYIVKKCPGSIGQKYHHSNPSDLWTLKIKRNCIVDKSLTILFN